MKFGSVLIAIECARIQSKTAERNAAIESGRRRQFRMHHPHSPWQERRQHIAESGVLSEAPCKL
jgi:hypothetical protein